MHISATARISCRASFATTCDMAQLHLTQLSCHITTKLSSFLWPERGSCAAARPGKKSKRSANLLRCPRAFQTRKCTPQTMFAGTQSVMIRNRGCHFRLKASTERVLNSKLERLPKPKLRSGCQPNLTVQHNSKRGNNATSNIARSNRGKLWIHAKMGQQREKRYPPGIQDIGFSLLRAPKLLLSDEERVRLDGSPDLAFYEAPRLMQHASTEFIKRLQGVYSTLLPSGGSVLELCASRHSHLPPGLGLAQLVGQGMNTAELSQNPDLTQWFVQDLNQQPLLLEQLDASYDAVLCVNGIQYLTQPETVITEAWRVLRPGGFLLVAFGCHFFPEKAIAGWTGRNTEQRVALMSTMLKANGFDQVLVTDAAAAATDTTDSNDTRSGTAVQPNYASQAAAADDIQVLVATKPSIPLFSSAAAATASSGGDLSTVGATDMRPDNVAAWFTKPGLAGLSASVSGTESGTAAPTGNAQVSSQQGDVGDKEHAGHTSFPAGSDDADPSLVAIPHGDLDVSGAFCNERLLEQWRASYGVLASDAVALGIPESVIPKLKEDASPADVQAAVQHLQAMVASFLSSGL